LPHATLGHKKRGKHRSITKVRQTKSYNSLISEADPQISIDCISVTEIVLVKSCIIPQTIFQEAKYFCLVKV